MKIARKCAILIWFIYLISSQGINASLLKHPRASDSNKNSNNTLENGPLLSFLSVSESEELKSTDFLQSKENLHENLLVQLTAGRKKRYTEDGRLCARAFVQEGKTYFDCTSVRSPDGQMKQKEWCYVDPNMKGTKVWDYCKPIMDYDKVREANQDYLREVTTECRKIDAEVESHVLPAQNALDELKRVKEGQADLDNKINLMLKDISTVKNNLQNLYSTKNIWEIEENKIVVVNEKIEKKLEKIKDEKNQPEEFYDDSEDTIRDEIQSSKAIINPIFQMRKKEKSKDCNGMLLYEEEKSGDGLIGHYFDNEAWLGGYVERKDHNIDFNWTGTSPVSKVNPNNYSVKWSGYLLAPYTGDFIFSIECDDGAALTINNKIVVSHNMHTATEERKERTDRWLTSEVRKKQNPNINHNKSVSKPVHLTGGEKFHIVLSYYHSVHDNINEDEEVFVRLLWKTDDFEEIVIPREYLYTRNSYPPLKITGISSEDAVIRKLYNNDLAFKNSKEFLIQDVPNEYIGATTLKLNTRYKNPELKFNSNSPVIVYIAYLNHYPNPLPSDFEDTFETVSLLQVDKHLNKNVKKVIAIKSGLMNVYKKAYPAGKIKIPLSFTGINVKGIPMIVFFGFDSGAGGPVSCGGPEINVSNSSGEYFKECSASSEYSGAFGCKNAFNMRMKDGPDGIWASRGEGQGAWIQVKFKQLIQLSRFEFQERNYPGERNSQFELIYDNGETELINLKNTNELREFKLKTVKTTSVKIVIKTVYGTYNNGGAFNFYGVPCINMDNIDSDSDPLSGMEKVAGVGKHKIKPLFNDDKPRALKLHCKDSVSNSRKFDSIKKGYNKRQLIYCYENCAPADVPIYGDNTYSKDSSVCKAAFHSQKLPVEGGHVWLVFKNGMNNYHSSFKNGVKSLSKGKSDLSLSFEIYKEEDNIILQPGSKIDFANPVKVGWVPAIIAQVTDKDEFMKILQITIEGDASPPLEVVYPDKKKIQPCGEFVKDRDCASSRRNINANKPVKIRFTPRDFNEAGDFVRDNGFVFGTDSHPYGFSKDISNRIRSHTNGSKPELNTLIEFPPSPKSKFCSSPSADTLCEIVTWSVKVGQGKFFVRIYMGDPSKDSVNNLKMNDNYIVKNELVQKNNLKVFEEVVESKNNFIILSPECEDNCDYAVTVLNAVEVMPYKEAMDKPEPNTNEQKGCGGARIGGVCETGPDVVHCLIDDPSKPVASNCNGSLMLMQITNGYHCKDQIGKFKCVKKSYTSDTECKQNCVQDCKKNECVY